MTKFEELLSEIEESEIFYIDSDSQKNPAKTIKFDDDYAIVINASAFPTQAERLVALAHEKGHCDTGAVYSNATPLITRGMCELRANKKATYRLIPLDELIEACLSPWNDVWDLAERFEVTEDFMHYALELYQDELLSAFADSRDI